MRWLRRAFPTLFAIVWWWRERLTFGGQGLLLALVACLPMASQGEMQWVVLASAFAALYGVGYAANLFFLPRLEVRARSVPQAMQGDSIELEIELKNSRRMPALDLTLEILPSDRWRANVSTIMLSRLGRGAHTICRTQLATLHRGLHRLPDLRIISTFPFNLFRRWATRKLAGEVAVFPRRLSIPIGSLACDFTDSLGAESGAELRSSDAEEYFGSREYQPGMPVRRWDHACWARLGRPAVREYVDSVPQRVTILVDTFHDEDRVEADDEFETTLSLAITLAEDLAYQNWLVDRFAVGTRMEGRHDEGGVQLETIRDLLAGAVRSTRPDRERVSEFLESSAWNTSLTIIVAPDGSQERLAAWRRIVSSGVIVAWLEAEGKLRLLALDDAP